MGQPVAVESSLDFGRPSPTRTQHSLRLLVLIDRSGESTTEIDPEIAIKVVRSELRIQAMDFWMRNPDYLADEIISQVEARILTESDLLTARSLLEDPEPDLHYYPMPRWFYGAYEAIDDAMALLETYGLALVRRSGDPRNRSLRNQFFLTDTGAEAVLELSEEPVLSWYTRQAELVARVAGKTIGSKLKESQYQRAIYAGTELGSNIAPIADEVRKRLDKIQDTRAFLGGAA